MAINSPAVVVGTDTFFTGLRPALDKLGRLGTFDFSADSTGIVDAPDNAYIPVPMVLPYSGPSTSYNDGKNITWGKAYTARYIYGYNLNGLDIDNGANAAVMRNRFSTVASRTLAACLFDTWCEALDDISAVTTWPLDHEPTAAEYMSYFAHRCGAMNDVGVAVSADRWGKMLSAFAAVNIVRKEDIETACGVKIEPFSFDGEADMYIIPYGCIGVMARIPAAVADYAEDGTITDEYTGLSVGLKVVNDQGGNKKVVNCDAWLAVAVHEDDPAGTAGVGGVKIVVDA